MNHCLTYVCCYPPGGFACFKTIFPHVCESEDVDQVGPSFIRLSDLRITNDEASPLKTCLPSSPFAEAKAKKGAVEILPNLFLGNAKDASDLRELVDRNISCILNVTNDIPNKFENDPRFTYMNLRVQDNWQTNLSDYFQEAFRFIGKLAFVRHLRNYDMSEPCRSFIIYTPV